MKDKIPCRALNLSASGILVRPSRRANPGSQFRVTFRLRPLPQPDPGALPGPSGWLDVEGRLVHRTWIEQRISWGIEFVCVPQSLQKLLRDFIGTDVAPRRPPPETVLETTPLQPERIPEIEVNVISEGDAEGDADGDVEGDAEGEGPTRQIDRARLRELARVDEMDDTGELQREEIDRLVRAMTPLDD